jgi:cell division protein FtsI (penicillin-binding protein 3)/stage V sporulation protein D (sporulation-specific penicillin-binding protein)
MDPTSGQVVAMGSTKRFDPNENKQHYRNVIIEDRYEFGSIMKPLTVAMALDDGAIDADFQYNDRGFMKLNQRTINNYDRQGRGPGTTLQTILSQSLNTGAATIAIKLGADTFIEYVDALGLSKETGVDLPYEVYGNTENIDTGREVELATASFGQGIAVTLVEMARAWGALANDGIVKTPYVVDMIEYGDLIPSRNIPPGGDQQVFDIETIRQVTDMLISIVDDTATFRSYSLPQHSIAIKTGTAQLARPEGGYYDDEFLHTIAGYFPAQAQAGDQQFVMIIFTYQPQGAQYSSTTLKDAFFNVTQFMISYYNLTPDRNTSSLSNYETVQE